MFAADQLVPLYVFVLGCRPLFVITSRARRPLQVPLLVKTSIVHECTIVSSFRLATLPLPFPGPRVYLTLGLFETIAYDNSHTTD